MKNFICFVLALTLVGVGGCRRRGNAAATTAVQVAQVTEDSPTRLAQIALEERRGKEYPPEPTTAPPKSPGPGITLPAKKSDEPKEPTTAPPKSPGPGVLQPLKEPRQITNSIGMKLTYIPPGKFMMGSGWVHVIDNKEHEVELTNGFYLGVFEVTQEEYQEIMGVNPSRYVKGAKLPVETVSWNDAQAFCKKLSAKEGKTYRLPTEAEWEYACRAGTISAFHFGDTSRANEKNYNGFHLLNQGLGKRTTPVGSFAPNAWGLHDMHGNVREWCEDWYSPEFYRSSPKLDPLNNIPYYLLGIVTHSNSFSNKGFSARVVRGGCWCDPAEFCRSESRGWREPDCSDDRVGFRLLAVPSSREPEQGKAGGKSRTE